MNEQPPSIWKRQFFPQLSVIRFFRWLFGWRMIRRYLFCLACLVTLVAVLYAVENWRGKHAWEKYKREWEAKGEVFDWKAFIPSTIPDDQNFATASFFDDNRLFWQQRTNRSMSFDTNRMELLNMNIFRKDESASLKEKGPDWMRAQRTDIKAFQEYYRAPANPRTSSHQGSVPQPVANEFPIAPQPQTPAADVLLALSKYSNEFEEFRDATKRPYSRFPVNYEATLGALLQHIAKIKSLSYYLELLTAAELEAGNTRQAAEAVDLHFYLINSIKSEPTLVSQIVRFSMFDMALTPIWEGMADHRWSKEQLRHFQDKMEPMNFLSDLRWSFAAERAMWVSAFDELGSARLDSHLAEMRFETYIRFAPRGWFDQQKLIYSQFLQEKWMTSVEPKSQRVNAELAKSANNDPRMTKSTAYNFFIPKFFPDMLLPKLEVPGETSASKAQTGANLAIVACALERYYLANKAYPEKLDQLVPQFISKLPHDIFNGNPLKYRRSEDGRIVVYSVGPDGKDDGGVYRPAKDGKETGDWVWRYPAK